MTYAITLERYTYGTKLYSYPCVKCQTDTAHRKGVCIVCKTISVTPQKQMKGLLLSRAVHAQAKAQRGGLPTTSGLVRQGWLKKRINNDRKAALARQAEESRKKFEGS